jgi:hypothetical protein
MARNQVVSGTLLDSKIIPAVSDWLEIATRENAIRRPAALRADEAVRPAPVCECLAASLVTAIQGRATPLRYACHGHPAERTRRSTLGIMLAMIVVNQEYLGNAPKLPRSWVAMKRLSVSRRSWASACALTNVSGPFSAKIIFYC